MEQIASLPNEDPCGLSIDTASFFGLDSVSCIRRRARLGLTDRSYLPKALDPRSDWVASVAVPAFLALAQTGVEARDFCTIGTGSGLDALAAIEILKAHNVVVLDLHEDVARQARRNIQDNIVMHFAGDAVLRSRRPADADRRQETRIRSDLRKPAQHPARHRRRSGSRA